MNTNSFFTTFFAAIRPLEKVVGALVVTQLQTNKAYIINIVDKGVVGAGEQLKAAIHKGFNASHNTILSLVLKPFIDGFDNFITSSEASLQTDAGALYDHLVQVIEAEVAKLTA